MNGVYLKTDFMAVGHNRSRFSDRRIEPLQALRRVVSVRFSGKLFSRRGVAFGRQTRRPVKEGIEPGRSSGADPGIE